MIFLLLITGCTNDYHDYPVEPASPVKITAELTNFQVVNHQASGSVTYRILLEEGVITNEIKAKVHLLKLMGDSVVSFRDEITFEDILEFNEPKTYKYEMNNLPEGQYTVMISVSTKEEDSKSAHGAQELLHFTILENKMIEGWKESPSTGSKSIKVKD